MAAVLTPSTTPGMSVDQALARLPGRLSRARISWVPIFLVGTALLYLALFLFVPLAAVFVEALRKGFGYYFDAIREGDAIAAITLTLTAAAIAVVMLVLSFALLLAINALQAWTRRRQGAAT